MSKSSRFYIVSFMMISLTIAAFILFNETCISLSQFSMFFFNSIERFFILLASNYTYQIKIWTRYRLISGRKGRWGPWKSPFGVISQSILIVLFNLYVLIAMLLMDTIPVVVISSFRVPTCILYYFLIIFVFYKAYHMVCPSCTIYI